MNCAATVVSSLLLAYMRKLHTHYKSRTFLGSDALAFSLDSLAEDAKARALDYNDPKVRMRKTFHIFPRVWKAIGDIAKGNTYDDYREKLAELEDKNPISIRHLLQIKKANQPVPTERVSIHIKT